MTTLNILACQIDIPAIINREQRDNHLHQTADKIRNRLAKTSADLVVLPELSSIEYSRETFDCLDQLAETEKGASYEAYREIARAFDATIVYGFPRIEQDKFYISQAAINPQGELIGLYDKLHIAHYGASMEKDYFHQGRNLLVFEHNGIRIAPIICYDIRFSELCRTLTVDHGVQLILHCGAYYRDESFASWHAFTTTRAMENQVYLLSLNRAGQSYGDSVFCPPWIDENNPVTNFSESQEQFQHLNLDTSVIQKVRDLYPFLKDRKPDYPSIPPL